MELHALIDFTGIAGELAPLKLAFGRPVKELVAWNADQVRQVLIEVQALSQQGFWCAGYLRYEAARAFEPAASIHAGDGPIAYFSVHDRTIEPPPYQGEPSTRLSWERGLDRATYDACIGQIHAAIARGEVYQVNYTAPLRATYAASPFDLFCALRRAQPHSHSAYFASGFETILSVSPELFFDWSQDRLLCRPMKGTAPRGATPREDRANADRLRSSVKDRAENVMIVDLIRNDMSRVAQIGSVQVRRLFECEPWPTVWQMTSTVGARTRPGIGLLDVFSALFPCGSITGAPKLKAMDWVRRLEPQARGVYCGAAGVVLPDGTARFNVPIRTVTLREGTASCGIGSGITSDSTAAGEWAEWNTKTQFLDQASRPFKLLQTLRAEAGQARHLALHVERLLAAARYFNVPVEGAPVAAAIARACTGVSHAMRARVTVDMQGRIGVELMPMEAATSSTTARPIALATTPVVAPRPFLRHKTTRRDHFDGFAVNLPDTFDTLLWNERGEITEFTRGNVVLELATLEKVTPPLECGLLDGVGRARLLASGHVRERIVHRDELSEVRALWFVNALRGLIPVYVRNRHIWPTLSPAPRCPGHPSPDCSGTTAPASMHKGL